MKRLEQMTCGLVKVYAPSVWDSILRFVFSPDLGIVTKNDYVYFMEQFTPKNHRRGQATAEMVIGLVGLTVAFLGLIQIADFGNNNIDNIYDARAAAEKRASGQFPSSPNDEHVSDWREGVDLLRYTADDVAVSGVDSLVVYEAELQYPQPLVEMNTRLGLSDYDWLTPMMEPDSIAYAANLRRANSARGVPVEPALQRFIFNGYQSVRLYDEAYMPSLEIMPGEPD